MKKAYALVIACILFLTFICMPFTGVFADSDIGISNSLLLSCFAWYTGTPGVDSAGIWYGSSFEDYSDSVEGGVAGTTSFGVQCLLNTSGDYVDYQLNEYPFYANSWNSPILIVQLLLDRSSYGGPVEDLAYEFYTDSNDVIYEPFYQYVVPRFTLNNTDYVVMNLFFNIGVSVNSGHPHIKIIYDGTPANFIAMGMRFMGYRYSPESTLTTAELYQIQTDLITSFNMARLLDAVGSDDSDIDLTSIENALASMDAKLTTIISNTDDVESLLTSINDNEALSYGVLNTFNQYFRSLFDNVSLTTKSDFIIKDTSFNDISDLTTLQHCYIIVPIDAQSYRNDLILVFLQLRVTADKPYNFNVDVYGINSVQSINTDKITPFYSYTEIQNDPSMYFKHLYIYTSTGSLYNYLFLDITCDHNFNIYPATQSGYYRLGHKDYNISWFNRIEIYFKNLLNGFGSNSVSDDIASTAAELDQEMQSVESFETTYNTQLQDAHDDVDLSGYTISATSGMTYLKTYTHNAFTASNGLRVFMIYPIIFLLIGIFLRRFA